MAPMDHLFWRGAELALTTELQLVPISTYKSYQGSAKFSPQPLNSAAIEIKICGCMLAKQLGVSLTRCDLGGGCNVQTVVF